MEIYKVKNVDKKYKDFYALKQIELTIEKGDFVVILGPSGSGKSTLLNILSGIAKPTDGCVYFDNQNITTYSENDLRKMWLDKIGFIFQNYQLIPTLNVRENIELGFNKNSGLKTNKLLTLLDIKKHQHKYPYQLSGGEQARVSIARALIKNPQVLLGDEITKSLDQENSKKVLEILKKINHDYQTTIIIVTHDKNISTLANKVIYLKNGQIEKIVNK